MKTDLQIETTIGALVEAGPALSRLIALPLGAKVRYHAVKLMKLVSAETQEHFFQPRLDAIKAFGVEREPTARERAQNGPGKILEVTPEHIPAFLARAKELADVPCVIPWGPITVEMLEPYDAFTGADMLALGPLFELDPPATAPDKDRP